MSPIPSVPQSPIQSPTDTGGVVLNGEKGFTDAGIAVEDKTHEKPRTHQSALLEAESFPEDEENDSKVPQSAKELAPFERPIQNITDNSLAAQTTPQETPKPSYRDLQRDNKELENNLVELRKEWKELGQVLSNLRAKHQPVGQLGGVDLISSAEKLRYNISNISQQWPRGQPSKSMPLQYRYYLQSTTPESSRYRSLLDDPDRFPQVIEAFIWRVLTGQVFGGFHWAGEEIALSIRNLEKWLAATANELDSPRRSDLQMWTSKTTELLLEALTARGHVGKQKASNHLQAFRRGIIDAITEALGLPLDSKECIVRQLDDIIDGALDLDRAFSQQVAKWGWKYSSASDCDRDMVFDEESMSLNQGEFLSKNKSQTVVKLVISPALVKCGDSKGENYDVETLGIKMVVSCSET